MKVKRMVASLATMIAAVVAMGVIAAPAQAAEKNGVCERGSIFRSSEVCLIYGNFWNTLIDYINADNNHADEVLFVNGVASRVSAANTDTQVESKVLAGGAYYYICNGVFLQGPCLPVPPNSFIQLYFQPQFYANNESHYWSF